MNAKEIRYPIGVQTFEKLRRGGYVYVDKTSYIPKLLSKSYYFLSRPRRFGKSLFLSTLEAYFKGKKELFEGLAIYDWEKEWKEYPVIHIDFNDMDGHDISKVTSDLHFALCKIAQKYGIAETFKDEWKPENYSFHRLFAELIERLHDKFGRNVVVLIDEYDKAIIELLDDTDKLKRATDELRPFFNVLKTCDKYIKFAFVTGVSRFRNTTLFSGANNLDDISLIKDYASLLGISHEELIKYFNKPVKEMSEDFGWTEEQTYEILRNRYDGYRFTAAKEYVYNPFSLIGALSHKELMDFWVETGSSIMLKKYLKDSDFTLQQLTDNWVSASKLGSTYSKEDPMSLLFQTGYLTISDYRFAGIGQYKLGIPNQEVQQTLAELVIPQFAKSYKENQISD